MRKRIDWVAKFEVSKWSKLSCIFKLVTITKQGTQSMMFQLQHWKKRKQASNKALVEELLTSIVIKYEVERHHTSNLNAFLHIRTIGCQCQDTFWKEFTVRCLHRYVSVDWKLNETFEARCCCLKVRVLIWRCANLRAKFLISIKIQLQGTKSTIILTNVCRQVKACWLIS